MPATARPRLGGAIVAVMLSLLLTAMVAGRASAQSVFDACYVDKTGVIYFIDPGGTRPGNLPTACIKPDKHIQFTWVDAAGADHGLLTGLGDDDHPQYVLASGLRAVSGNLVVMDSMSIGTAARSSGLLTIQPRGGGPEIEFPPGTEVGNDVDIVAQNRFNIGTIGTGLHPVAVLTQGVPRLFVTGAGKVGIGTTTPNTLLSVADTIESTHGGFKFPDGTFQVTAALPGYPKILADGITSTTNGFAVTGTYGTGTIPATGGGTRLMWYPGKAAFRVGRVAGTDWDDPQIGRYSTAMGEGTLASGDHSIAMGYYARALGRRSIAMGTATIASGAYTTAMGRHASTNGFGGSFVYGDNCRNITGDVSPSAANQFVVRACGGTTFYSDPGASVGVTLVSGGGSWTTISDRNRKHHFQDVSGEDVLAKIANIPIPSWSYRAQADSIRHIGPMAQDFYAAFRLGTSDLTITTSDISGVNMRAIQALEQRTRELNVMREQLEALQADRASLEARLAALESALRSRGRP